MHPPFFIVDHKIGHDIHHFTGDRPIIRRGAPVRLALRHTSSGWPPIPLQAGAFTDNGALHLPSGAMLPPVATLRVVPPPQRRWRDMLGRLLIRTGQRLIMENRV